MTVPIGWDAANEGGGAIAMAQIRTELRSDEATGERWIVINTQTHRENVALENLRRQRFEAYCPMIRRQRRHRGRFREVLRPLFPSYLFVATSSDRSWRPILSTYGVRRVIRFGEEAGYLAPEFIERLREREVEGVIAKPPTAYAEGQEIRISRGPFDGLIAKILEVQDDERLIVLLSMLGQSVRGRIHANDVVPHYAVAHA